MTIIEALEFLEATPDGNARLEALKKADEACLDLRSILFLAMSPDVTFGVKKLPDVLNNNAGDNDERWLSDTRALLSKLRYRELTGNAAQEDIGHYLAFLSDVQRKWSERILRQDLRLNLGAKEVNKVLGEDTIYLFTVPLATDYAKVKEKDLNGSWALQPKLDGGRCVAILHGNGRVEMKSRTGKEWGNFESIKKELVRFNKERVAGEKNPQTVYMDGEVISRDPDGAINFQSIQKTMMRKDGVEVGDLQFIVFDVAFEDEWKKPTTNYATRLTYAHVFVPRIQNWRKVDVVSTSWVSSPSVEELQAACAIFVEQGFEGAMLRHASKPVVNKRSKTLIKVKLFSDLEAEITGLAELQREGKGAGTLGAFVCKLKNGIQFEVGSGFTAKQREEFWANPPIGEMVQVKYFELTDDGKPRLPIYRSIRAKDDIGKEEDE